MPLLLAVMTATVANLYHIPTGPSVQIRVCMPTPALVCDAYPLSPRARSNRWLQRESVVVVVVVFAVGGGGGVVVVAVAVAVAAAAAAAAAVAFVVVVVVVVLAKYCRVWKRHFPISLSSWETSSVTASKDTLPH